MVADYIVNELGRQPMGFFAQRDGKIAGTLGIPQTSDGGGITAPSLAFYTLDGKWAVENEGVAPDIEVEYTPAEVMKGRDPQLERAVQEAMKMLEQQTLRRTPRPAPIVRTKGQ